VENESDRTPSYEITPHSQDIRLDVFLATHSNDLSRSRIQALIKRGFVEVNNGPSKPSYKLKAGDHVFFTVPPPETPVLEPEAIEFGIIHEDNSLIVIDKPAGIVVHPAPGHNTGTLVHGLLEHCRDLSGIGGVLRPGIVHRLDKDTSGLMVVAKNDQAHSFLSSQFKAGRVKKQYVALVHGIPHADEQEIDLPISRHPKKRKEMAVTPSGGKRALTRWNKIEEFQSGFSLLSVSIKTGRTHQIRVHLSHVGHPVVGDRVYGYSRRWWKRHPLYKMGIFTSIGRQMLHAKYLGFVHPDGERYLEFESPLPDDMDHAVLILNWLDLRSKTNKELDINELRTIFDN
jgi:23S rRNA pseudouridine1911/1915/1917 synthase